MTKASSQGTGQEYCHVQWSGHQPFTTITKEKLPLCQLTKLHVEKWNTQIDITVFFDSLCDYRAT